PAEVLCSEDRAPAWLAQLPSLRRRPPWQFESRAAQDALCRQFGTQDLAGFGCAELPLAIGAAGALLAYLGETQRIAMPHLRGLVTERRDEALILDAVARRNLEIETSLVGRPEHTLAG